MPPKYKSRKRVSQVEDYDSDGGFVEDAPRTKKAKINMGALSKEAQKDDEGNEYWEISGKRRVTVSDFKNMKLISIREYYEKDGKSLPGKKGISLSVEQFNALVELLPQIETCLQGKGETISRPSYNVPKTAAETSPTAGSQEVEEGKNDEEGSNGDGHAIDGHAESLKLDRFKHTKKNHEATSDEED